VKNKLEDSGRILGGRQAAFDKDPTKSASNENNTFKVLQGIFADIVHHGVQGGETEGGVNTEDKSSGGKAGEDISSDGEAGEGTSGDDDDESKNRRAIPLFTFHNNPNQAPYSERHSNTRPDG
jgi:hypothetical protein